MNVGRVSLLLAASLLFLLIGALGLRTVEDCDQDKNVVSDSQKMACYRSAAITWAFAGDKDKATGVCRAIWNEFGQPYVGKEGYGDAMEKAQLVSNSCFAEVAKTLADPQICAPLADSSQQHSITSSLVGSSVSYEVCYEVAYERAQFNPKTYYSDPNNSNICMMVFILPLFVAAAIRR
jgi:hypothetical protein